MIVNLPFLNEINSESLKDYYQVDIDLRSNKIQLDINFDDATVDQGKLFTLENYLNDLGEVIDIAKKGIFNDFENGDNVEEFLSFHIEELDQSELDTLLERADKTLSLEQQILSILKIKRIGFYPEDDDNFAILDFTLNEELSQYLLVVILNESKVVNQITMES